MMACLDVHYFQDKANAAAIVFSEWTSSWPASEYRETVFEPAGYEPGRFYLRKLLPLRAVIDRIKVPIDYYVIDAYCHLSPNLSPGLGAYLYESLVQKASIIGVAKSRYRDSTHAIEIFRGESKGPLFITSVGLEYQQAAQYIASMAGEFRIPTLVKAADRLSRTQSASGGCP